MNCKVREIGKKTLIDLEHQVALSHDDDVNRLELLQVGGRFIIYLSISIKPNKLPKQTQGDIHKKAIKR